ncbi:MAG TPA: hypothetical protein VLM89_09230, partial [Phycisphaerae bacterium]|nr:hypothetical protein [Phycisphaerae bacterium]
MSDVPQHISLSRQLTGRWQIPLLLVSLGLLMAGVWRLRPAPKPPTFEELFTRSATLKDAKLYSQASRHIESVLSNPELKLSVLERGRLQALMAEVIYLHELGNAVHGAGNARSILSNLDWASAAGVADSVDRQMMRARACEWLNRGAEAVEAYRRALAGGVADPWAVRKRIVQIDRESGRIAGDQLQAELDPFLAGDDVPDEMRYWALEQKVVLLGEEQKYQEADALLASQSRRPVGENWRNQREFLQALVAYHLGRSEEAEPLLRVLRDRVVPGDPLYARASWLLGRILQSHEAPQPALSFY